MRVLLLVMLGLLSACDDMTVQPKQLDYSPEMGPARIPTDTVEFDSGAGAATAHAPPVTLALLRRGQERYRIYCTPCHAELGDGHGMIVQRGFPAPPWRGQSMRPRSRPQAHAVHDA